MQHRPTHADVKSVGPSAQKSRLLPSAPWMGARCDRGGRSDARGLMLRRTV